jgi:DNA replication initiation complex subunit (GINS family)
MYNDLYDVWKLELENVELQKLPLGFYTRVAEYLKQLKEESRMLEKRATKATLLNREMENTRRMIIQLIRRRYLKIVRNLSEGKDFSRELLAPEEKMFCSGVLPFEEVVESFTKEILFGRVPMLRTELPRRRCALRFVGEVPTVIGADMKTYGPFRVEDVAALPLENTKILIRQGLAEKVDAE